MSQPRLRRDSMALLICLAEGTVFGMIGNTKADIGNLFSGDVIMPAATVIGLSETTAPKTYEEGLEFIARMRRQLDRFDVAFPGANGNRMAPETEAKIRTICDELEADLHKDLGIT